MQGLMGVLSTVAPVREGLDRAFAKAEEGRGEDQE